MSVETNAERWFENLTNKETLQFHLSFLALFISMYESFTEKVLSDVESMLCDLNTATLKNNKLKFTPSEQYREQIINRKIDDHGNKNALKATMLWFVELQAITSDEYDKFLVFKEKRNKYVHEMSNFLLEGLDEKDAHLLMSMFDLFCKIDKWWINEIEIPIAGECSPGEYDEEAVQSVLLLSYKMMLNTLYRNDTTESDQ